MLRILVTCFCLLLASPALAIENNPDVPMKYGCLEFGFRDNNVGGETPDRTVDFGVLLPLAKTVTLQLGGAVTTLDRLSVSEAGISSFASETLTALSVRVRIYLPFWHNKEEQRTNPK